MKYPQQFIYLTDCALIVPNASVGSYFPDDSVNLCVPRKVRDPYMPPHTSPEKETAPLKKRPHNELRNKFSRVLRTVQFVP